MNEHERILEIIRTKNSTPVGLDPARTALVVVDMQRYRCTRRAWSPSTSRSAWVRSAAEVVEALQGAASRSRAPTRRSVSA